MNAAPDPYNHSFKIYSVTRPADLKMLGESYEVDPEAERIRLAEFVDPTADLEPAKFEHIQPDVPVATERQESTGFEFLDESTGQPQVEEVVNPTTGEINSIQIVYPIQETGGKDFEEELELPDEFFVKYDPEVIPVKDLPGLGGGAFNVLCQNQQAWFKVDREKALAYGVQEDKILVVKGTDKLVDMKPYLQMSPGWETKGLTDEAIQAYNSEVCMTSTDVLRHVSFQFGHAGMKVTQDGFLLTSWLKSLNPSDLWHEYKKKKPDFMPEPVLLKSATPEQRLAHEQLLKLYEEYEERLARFEDWERWYEDYRASRSKESLLLMFWPDWLENILTEEHPLFLEKGVWNESYRLTIKRRDVEMIDLNARLRPTGIWQNTVLTSYQGFESSAENDAVGMRSALMLPFHVLSGEVLSTPNDYTFIPFARPRYEPLNRKLTLHVYHTHYRPELDREYGVKWTDIPVIPAVVYDFYSDDDDSDRLPVDQLPRLTYWIGEGGDFDGRLLGRRILYKTTGKKPIGCDIGSPVCHYEYSIYKGLEYRLVVSLTQQPEKEQEGSEITQSDQNGAAVKQPRIPPKVGATGATRQEKMNTWFSYFTGGRKASELIQDAKDEMDSIAWDYLTSEFYGYISAMAFTAVGVKNPIRTPIPTLPIIIVTHILGYLNLIH